MPNKTKKRIDEPSAQMIRYAENRAKGMNKKESALKAGYSKTTASTVKTAIESKGSFEKLLNKVGLTKDLVCSAIVEDIKNKPSFRQSELALASKILGMLSDKLDITSKGLKITFDSAFKDTLDEATESPTSNESEKDE